MGTRNLTMVRSKGKIKVAQYGQWDGYPTGQGNTIAEFLKVVDLARFKKQVNALGEYTEKDIRKAYKDAGANPDDQFITMELADKVNKEHPALCRDFGAGILTLIHEGKVTKVVLQEDYKNCKTGFTCEYWYEIDLDKETVMLNDKKTYTFKQWKSKDFMKKLEAKEGEDE